MVQFWLGGRGHDRLLACPSSHLTCSRCSVCTAAHLFLAQFDALSGSVGPAGPAASIDVAVHRAVEVVWTSKLSWTTLNQAAFLVTSQCRRDHGTVTGHWVQASPATGCPGCAACATGFKIPSQLGMGPNACRVSHSSELACCIAMGNGLLRHSTAGRSERFYCTRARLPAPLPLLHSMR